MRWSSAPAASTLIVDPGAVFNGLVVANAAVNDVLELAGKQSGGTALTLGTQFTNFSTLDFASAASGTVDATKAALTVPGHPLTIDGFALGDTLDITNLAAKGAKAVFNTTTEMLKITQGTTTIDLQFNSAFAGEHFVLSAAGSGTDVSVGLGGGCDAGGLESRGDEFRERLPPRIHRWSDHAGAWPGIEFAADGECRCFGSYERRHRIARVHEHGVAHADAGVCKA